MRFCIFALLSLFLFSFYQPVFAEEHTGGISLEESFESSGTKLPGNLPTFELGDETSPVRAFESILLDYVIYPIFLLAGGVAVIVIMYSSLVLITGRGQEESLTSTKTTLIWAFVGLGLIILAYTIVSNLASIIIETL